MKWKVLATREIPSLEKLSDLADVEILSRDFPPSRERIIDAIRDKNVLISLLTDRIDREVISAAPNLKVIANYAVGFDNIDVEFATRRGIVVLNTPDVLANAVAELTWALILSAARRIIEGHKLIESGKSWHWKPDLLLGIELRGKTIGIIGFGKIGRNVARIARGFGMKILYYSRKRYPSYETMYNAEYKDLRELLRLSDVVTIHTPLTKETYHLIGDNELSLMKNDAILVNVARGGVVDENALIKYLESRKIFYAALDVFENEPEVNSRLKTLDNVVLTPHIGSATTITRKKMGDLLVDGIIRIMKNEIPDNIVNPEVLGLDKRNVVALILAGGYARRLSPLSDFIPKPLLPINGKPMLNRMIEMLNIRSVSEIIVSTNEKYRDQFEYWLSTIYAMGFEKPIDLIIEPTTREEEKFGAIKGILYAIRTKNIQDDLLIVAGDNVMQIDFEDFIKFSKNKISVAIYDIGNLDEARRFGVVTIDKDSRITSFREKPAIPESTIVCAGCYYIPKEYLNLLSEYIQAGENPDSPGYFIQWLHKKIEIYGYLIRDLWMDIGTLEAYNNALNVLKNRW